MILSLGATLAAVLATPQESGAIVLRHDLGPRYSRTDYEAACGSNVFRVRFGSWQERHGRVEHVMIDGRLVPGAAEWLQARAAQRPIETIGIMNCGTDARQSVFRGVMRTPPGGADSVGMQPLLFFRILRHNGEWRMVLDP